MDHIVKMGYRLNKKSQSI